MPDDNPRSRDRVFGFIVRYKREHDGLSPSIIGIARGCALGESTVRYHLMKLEIEDRIRILGRRAIEVTGGVWDLPPDEEMPGDAEAGDGTPRHPAGKGG